MPRKPDPDARRKLLAAAREAFAAVGVDAARIEDIARAAGLSKGAFYLHFESKEAVFSQLVEDFFAVMRDLADQRQDARNELCAHLGSPTAADWREGSARLRAWSDLDHVHTVYTLQAMWRHRDVLHAILAQTGARRGLIDQLIDVTRDMLAAQLADAMAAGGLRSDLDRELVSELILGMYLQLGRRMTRSSTRPDFETWARTVDSVLVEGLAPRSADQPVTIGVA
jgi:AcrR family transcriptional regulator